jgi:hypothetical protein
MLVESVVACPGDGAYPRSADTLLSFDWCPNAEGKGDVGWVSQVAAATQSREFVDPVVRFTGAPWVRTREGGELIDGGMKKLIKACATWAGAKAGTWAGV